MMALTHHSATLMVQNSVLQFSLVKSSYDIEDKFRIMEQDCGIFSVSALLFLWIIPVISELFKKYNGKVINVKTFEIISDMRTINFGQNVPTSELNVVSQSWPGWSHHNCCGYEGEPSLVRW